MKFQASNGVDFLDIAADAAKPCEFTASGTVEGKTAEWKVVMGANGVGAYRARFVNPDTPGTNGYIFPAQTHSYSALRGTWSFLQSGKMGDEGLVHLPGKVTFDENRKVTVCDYDTGTWVALCNTTTVLDATDRSDGGFDIGMAEDSMVTVYMYRAPNGSFALFGSTNPDGATTTIEQSSLIGAQLSTLALPEVNSVVKYWDVMLSTSAGSVFTAPPTPDANTVIAVDAATQAVTRKRASDSREDVVRYNQPLAGLRTRDAGTFNGLNFAKVYQFTVPGMGLTLSANGVPAGPTSTYIASISVVRP
jgi:hypothetical protein